LSRSLQEFLLRQLAELAARPSVEEVVARARGRVQATGTRLGAQQILAEREEDRR
jgi:hypothetical protein